MSSSIPRRRFLQGAVSVGSGVALAGFASAFGLRDAYATHDHTDDIPTILNLAATAETLAATSYYGTLMNNPLGFSNEEMTILKLALSAEMYHLEILQSLGGRSLADRFFVPTTFLSDRRVNINTFLAAETAFTGAYLAATRRLAELEQPRLAATTAQHAATEAEHLALTRLIGGLVPNPNALPAPIYYNVSDAAPVLGPFLQGGKGFIGPVAFPGRDAIMQLLGKTEATRVPPFVKVF